MSGKIWIPVLATLMAACFVLPPAAQAQTLVPAPTNQPPPATDPPPTQPAPTADLPGATATDPPPLVPTTPPDSGGNQREPQPAPPPTQGPAQVGGQPTLVFRTPRPTRTPRAVTPTATPLSAAAFRLTVSADTTIVRSGDTIRVRATLLNQSPFPVAQLLLELGIPVGFLVEAVSPLTGTADPAGDVIHWTIPALDAGAQTHLTLRGLVQSVDQEIALCATLLSSGSPVESCIALVTDTGAGSEDFALDAPLAVPAFTSGSGSAPTLEWILLLLGLLLLGLWGGTALRARRASRLPH